MRSFHCLCILLSALSTSPVAFAQWNGRYTPPPWVSSQISKSSSISSVSASSHAGGASSQAGGVTSSPGATTVGGTVVATKITSSKQAVLTGGTNSNSAGSLAVNSGSATAAHVGSSLVATNAVGGAVATGTSAATASNPSGGSQICFKFSGSNFYYQNAYTWGTGSGQGGGTTQCFSSTAVGGAMFLSNAAIRGDGDLLGLTKLECTFGGLYQNCDISLVDGFSVPLQCQIPGGSPPTIGGLTNLWTLGANCDSENASGACNNGQGYAPSQSSVTQFFVNANWTSPEGPMPAGGNYCVWKDCSKPSDSFFTGTPTINCQVGTGGKTKRSVDLSQEWLPGAAEEKKGNIDGTILSDANQDLLDARELDGARSQGVRMRARRRKDAYFISR